MVKRRAFKAIDQNSLSGKKLRRTSLDRPPLKTDVSFTSSKTPRMSNRGQTVAARDIGIPPMPGKIKKQPKSFVTLRRRQSKFVPSESEGSSNGDSTPSVTQTEDPSPSHGQNAARAEQRQRSRRESPTISQIEPRQPVKPNNSFEISIRTYRQQPSLEEKPIRMELLVTTKSTNPTFTKRQIKKRIFAPPPIPIQRRAI